MPFHIQSKVIILWALVSVFMNYKNVSKRILKNNILIYLTNSLWLIWLLVTLVYTSDVDEGLREFQKSISFLIIPIVFFFFSKKEAIKSRRPFFISFVIVMLCYTLYMCVYLHYRYYPEYNITILKDTVFNFYEYIKYLTNYMRYAFYDERENIGFPLFFHKHYYSLSLILCIIFLIQEILIKKKLKYKLAGFFIAILFSSILLYYFSKIHLILFFIIIPFAFIMFYFQKELKLSIFIKVFIVSIAFGFIGYNFLPNTVKNKINFAVESRLKISNCVFELFDENIISGYGLGGVEEQLVECYSEKLKTNPGYKYQFDEKQNSHNYYFHIYLSSGIIGLVLFIMMFYFNFKIALKNNDILYFCFLIIIVFSLLVENTFSRIYGVLFFSIFNSIFLKKYLTISEG